MAIRSGCGCRGVRRDGVLRLGGAAASGGPSPGVLGAELARLFGDVDGLTVAGRTDAGVHATGQVCHVDVPRRGVGRGSAARWSGGWPGCCRGDVRVPAVAVAPAGFDARFSALWRRYEYRVADTPWGADPLRRHDTLAWPRPLALEALNAAAAGLVGEHDFAAYCRRKEHGTTVRSVQRLDWRRDPDGVLVATVQADAFCQAMVRSLVGAMLAAGDGRRPVEWPGTLLQPARAGQRGAGGAAARPDPGGGRLPGGRRDAPSGPSATRRLRA